MPLGPDACTDEVEVNTAVEFVKEYRVEPEIVSVPDVRTLDGRLAAVV